jgi:hypothetical protein
MTRRSAKEIKEYSANLDLPFYRFQVMDRNRSFQHTSLVELDDSKNLVFYAAPRFDLFREIDEVWKSGHVANRSIFVTPREIGFIEDDEPHHVAFDSENAFFCSEPRRIDFFWPESIRDAV